MVIKNINEESTECQKFDINTYRSQYILSKMIVFLIFIYVLLNELFVYIIQYFPIHLIFLYALFLYSHTFLFSCLLLLDSPLPSYIYIF